MNLNKMIKKECPLIAVSVSDNLKTKDFFLIKKYNADIIELRIDLLQNRDLKSIIAIILKIKENTKKCVLATIRSLKEGGKHDFSKSEKLYIYKNIIPIIDYIDIELNSKYLYSLIPYAKKNKVKVIISYHNFIFTPSINNLNKLVLSFKKTDGDILKIAVMPNTLNDVRKLLEFSVSKKNIKIITIAMGKLGMLSRVFFKVVGSLITFSSLNENTAPGQIKLKRIRELIDEFYSYY